MKDVEIALTCVCGVPFKTDNPNRKFCSPKCYQKYYHKGYYERNGDRLRKYGSDYFQKKQALLKFSKLPVVNSVRVRIVAPQLSTNGLKGTIIPCKNSSHNIKVLLDGYKQPQIYHPDFIRYEED